MLETDREEKRQRLRKEKMTQQQQRSTAMLITDRNIDFSSSLVQQLHTIEISLKILNYHSIIFN